MKRWCHSCACVGVVVVMGLASSHHLFAIQEERPEVERSLGHWPQWRGPRRDNVSEETGLVDQWPDGGPPLEWRVEGLGQGIASVSIADGHIYTTTYKNATEFVVSLHQVTGRLTWAVPVGAAVAENPLMRWLSQRTPTIDGDRLYVVTAHGELVCLSTEDGSERWRKNYIDDFGGRRGRWGFCDYPLIDGEKLICAPGGDEVTMVALNKITGELIWKCRVDALEGFNHGPSYAATVLLNVSGMRQYLTLYKGSLVGVAAEDGQLLWRYDKINQRVPRGDPQNALTPLVEGNRVFCVGGRGAALALLKLVPYEKQISVQEEYTRVSRVNHFQDHLILVGGHVFASERDRRDIPLSCIELENGEPVWRHQVPRTGRQSRFVAMTYADGHLYVRSATGVVTLVEASPAGYVERGSFGIPDHQQAIGATTPVIAGGHLYLRDDDKLFSYDIRQHALDAPRPVPATVKLSLSTKPPRVGQDDGQQTPRRGTESVFVPTPQDIVEKMLETANVTEHDVVCDLGSGDGRIVITAAKKYGSRAIGVEIDGELAETSRAKARQAGVADLVTIERGNIFDVDLGNVSVVAVYLLPEQLERLIPQLKKLKPGSRIVSHYFKIPGVKPNSQLMVESEQTGERHQIYLWTTPLRTVE